jgi:hypothetical protein
MINAEGDTVHSLELAKTAPQIFHKDGRLGGI